MALDRRTVHEIAQALLRARNKKDRGDIFENIAQTSMVPGEGSYGEPGFGGTENQPHGLIPPPHPHPFRDPAGFSYTGEVADMAQARGISAHDPLASKVVPSTLSGLANLQSNYGRPLEVNAGYSIEQKPSGGYRAGRAFGLNNYPTPNAVSERAVGLAQMGVGETGTYQSPERLNDPRIHTDTLRRRSSGHGGTAKTTPPGHSADILHLADGEPDTTQKTPHQENKLPKVRYPTSGEMVSEFLGGIGKSIAQTLADIAISDAEARLAAVDGIYVDISNPDLFGPSTSPWDHDGRIIAPVLAVSIKPAPLGKPKTWGGKIIGKVTPPKHLKPGTVAYGHYMHERVGEFLQESFPGTTFRFNIKPGLRRPDMPHLDGPMAGASYLEIKTNKPHSEKELRRQIHNWGYEETEVRAITYDEQGNIYDGFGH